MNILKVLYLIILDNILEYEGNIEAISTMFRHIKFIDKLTEDRFVIFNQEHKLLKQKHDVNTSESVLSVSIPRSLNSISRIQPLSVGSSPKLNYRKILNVSSMLSNQRSLQYNLNNKRSSHLLPISHPSTPTLDIFINCIPFQSSQFNPTSTFSYNKSNRSNTLLKKIQCFQLKDPEFASAKFNISDLISNSFKSNTDYDSVCLEWIRIYRLLDKHKEYLKQIFIAYNMNYAQNVLRLEFRLDSLHFEKITKLNYVVFKKICSDMSINIKENILMNCFYFSTRALKELPSYFFINYLIGEDKNWMKSELIDGNRNHYLTFPGFVEALMRISKFLNTNEKYLSHGFEKLINNIPRQNLVNMEGAILLSELDNKKVEEILNYYNSELYELYNKSMISDWSNLLSSQYSSYGKISLNGFI